MTFTELPIAGAFLIGLEQKSDERGFFGRVFCREEFGGCGLKADFVQVNDSYNLKKGTLRGMHYQLPPSAEVKVVRCIRGAVFDVVLDLRKDSPTFGQSHGAELSAENRQVMYVPEGCAHGFVTLQDDTELIYFVTQFYDPKTERGIRWNDPRFKIQWPVSPVVISERDRSHRDFDPAYHLTS